MAQRLDEARRHAPGHLVDTPFGKLHAVRRGKGPELVLVHGVTDSHSTWHHLQHTLAERYRTHAVDLPAHGLSDNPEKPLTLEQMGRAVLAYVERACEGPVLVVGNSMGGGVAMAMARHAPGRVRALCLLNSLGVRFPPPPGLSALRRWPLAELAARAAQNPARGREFLRENYAPTFRASDDDVHRFWSHWAIAERPAALRALLKVIDAAEPAPWLSALAQPVAVVHGDQDRTIPLWVASKLVSHLPRARLYALAGVGHQPQVECPHRVVELLEELERWSQEPSQPAARG